MILEGAHAVARRVLVLAAIVVAIAAPAAAQKPTFDIEGIVTDAQQAVLPGATVTLQNVATGLSREIATDENGRYVFTALPPAGQYVLQTTLAGFATERRENLTFNAGQRVVLNITLKLSNVQETVTVAGESPVVQTTTSEVTKTIESRDLVSLPVPERNYFRLLTLDSNVVARAPGTNGLYVGGGDVWNFGTYVDGTSNFSKWLTLQRAPQRGSAGFALETVSQVQIITNQFSAEFGGHSAGVMNMITKSGSNKYSGAALLVVRPGDLDAIPPLATQKVPFNQQQFGGNVGGPLVRDRAFFFGSYERRRERSQVSVTSPEAPGTIIPTPADEDQGHVRGDVRFSPSQSLAVRYNMVRWKQDNEGGGLQLPGTGYIWTNNVDTLHNMWTSIISDRVLNEVRGQWSRYYDLRAAKCDCVQFNRTGYSISGGVATGTWGVIPEDTWDVSDTLSLWRGNHSFKMGGGATYDVTTQRYLPNQNGIYNFAGGPAVAPNPNLYTQAFALVPGQDVIYPKAWVFSSFAQDDWRVRPQLHAELRRPLRRRARARHSGLARPDRQEQRRSARRLQLGSARRSAVVGARRRRAFHPAEPDLHHRQGRGAGPKRHRDARAAAERPGVPEVPEHAARLPSGRGAAGAQHPGNRAGPGERVRVAVQPRRAAAARLAHERVGRRERESQPQARLPRHQLSDADPEGGDQRGRRPDRADVRAGRPHAADQAGTEWVPAHRGPHERGPDVVSGHSIRRAAPDEPAACSRSPTRSPTPRIG